MLEMERNKVDDNRDVTCSYGFHIASFDYADTFQAGRMMIVKVNPKDVVSVPSDHGNQKCRVSRYEVVGEDESKRDVLASSYINKFDKNDGKSRPVPYHNVRDAYGRFTKAN